MNKVHYYRRRIFQVSISRGKMVGGWSVQFFNWTKLSSPLSQNTDSSTPAVGLDLLLSGEQVLSD